MVQSTGLSDRREENDKLDSGSPNHITLLMSVSGMSHTGNHGNYCSTVTRFQTGRKIPVVADTGHNNVKIWQYRLIG